MSSLGDFDPGQQRSRSGFSATARRSQKRKQLSLARWEAANAAFQHNAVATLPRAVSTTPLKFTNASPPQVR